MIEHRMPIPSRAYNAAVGGHVCGPEDIDFGQKVVHLIKYDRAGNEVSFESQVTQANKIYVIHDDFTLSSNVTILENCVLEFNGGSISGAYTLTGNNTSINAGLVKIFNTNVTLAGTWDITEAYPEWFGAKGDGVTDDTDAFSKIVTLKHIKLSNKTYCARNITFDGYCSLKGTFRESSILKQIDGSTGDFITLINCCYSLFENFSVAGGKNITETTAQQALVKVKVTNQPISTWGTVIQNICIRDSEYNGISFLGVKYTQENLKGNWVFAVHNLYIINCKHYCLYNNSTDNLFSNLYLSRAGWANLMDEGASCMWSNAKLDGYNTGYSAEVETDDPVERLNSETGYAIMIVRGIDLSSYVNFDIQSAAYVGIKIINTRTINISCSTNNCAYYVTLDGYRPTKEKTEECYNYPGLYLKDVTYSNITYRALRYINQYQSFRASGSNFYNTLIINDNVNQGADNSFGPLYNFDLEAFKLTNKVIDPTTLMISINNRVIKNLLPEISSSTYYGEIDNTGKVFGGDTPSLHLYSDKQSLEVKPDSCVTLYPHNTYLFLAVVYVEETYSGNWDVYKSPYFNITGVPGTVNLNMSRVGRERAKPATGDKYIIGIIHNNQTDAILKTSLYIRAYQTDGSFYVANIVCYNLTHDLGYNFKGITYNYSSIFKTIFSGQNKSLLEGNTPFGDLNCLVEASNYNTTDSGKTTQVPIAPCEGYTYFNTDISKPTYRSGDKWIESDGVTAGINRSGTFANKPSASDIYVGFKYFCTDKQTTEGATDGIEIIHKGNNVWVDALGRVVS